MSGGFTLWFTGLPSAGKSTLAEAMVAHFQASGAKVELLDGDVVRTHLSKGLGFSQEDREINIRRIGFVCDLLSRNDVIAIAACISPYRAVREELRALMGKRFVEIYVNTPLEECQRRDVKGLYARSQRREMAGLTGVDAPYESPESPEIVIETQRLSVTDSVHHVVERLAELGYVQTAKA